jgi:hypothetical protein
MADCDAWEKAESLSKIFAAVSIPVVLGVASLLANQALEKSETRDELLKQPIDVVFLSKSDQMAGADKSLESRSPFKPTSYYTSSRWAGGLAIGSKVFISYRRGDSAAYAGRVWDRLERDLGRHFLSRHRGGDRRVGACASGDELVSLGFRVGNAIGWHQPRIFQHPCYP